MLPKIHNCKNTFTLALTKPSCHPADNNYLHIHSPSHSCSATTKQGGICRGGGRFFFLRLCFMTWHPRHWLVASHPRQGYHLSYAQHLCEQLPPPSAYECQVIRLLLYALENSKILCFFSLKNNPKIYLFYSVSIFGWSRSHSKQHPYILCLFIQL